MATEPIPTSSVYPEQLLLYPLHPYNPSRISASGENVTGKLPGVGRPVFNCVIGLIIQRPERTRENTGVLTEPSTWHIHSQQSNKK